jgi:hypothetical protein
MSNQTPKRSLVVLAEITVRAVDDDLDLTVAKLAARLQEAYPSLAVIDYRVEAEDEAARSFTAVLKQAVEHRFAGQDITEQLGDPESPFVRHWKLSLTEHLRDTTERALIDFLADIDSFRYQAPSEVAEAGAAQSPPPSPTASRHQVAVDLEEWHKPFAIASVCREDLRGILAAEEIAGLSDDEMEDIADRMSDTYRDSGGYWESLEIMAEYVLKRKEAIIE